MCTYRSLATVIGVSLVFFSCGGGDEQTGGSSGDTAATTDVTIGVSTSTSGPSTEPQRTTEGPVNGVTHGQPAIWPASDVVFDTPEDAAADFVSEMLGVDPVLGPYMAGDSRSGEMEIYFAGEGDASTPASRGLLVLRQLGPDNAWFVLAVANENATVTSPEPMSVIPADKVTVEGVGTGFEATVVVSAVLAGDADVVFDLVVTHGGSRGTLEPYSVELDLSGAAPGDVITLLVRGDAGHESDPGEVGAVPVVIQS